MNTATEDSEWRLVPLGSIAKFRNGINYNKSNFGAGIKVLNVKDFQDRIVVPVEDLNEINPEGVVSQESLLENGDIVFVRSNGNRQLIGRSLFVGNVQDKMTHSAFTIRVRFTSDHAIPRFYSYLFRSSFMRQIFSSQGGGTNINNLNQRILENLQVPLPPLPTQRKIAAILSAYDDLIENNTRRIKILEEMAQALYREWFVHFRFPGHEKVRMVDSPLGKMPEGWEVYALGQFGDVRTGKTPSKLVPEYFGDHTPFIKIPDMHGNMFCIRTSEYLSHAGMESQRKNTLPPNALCVSCIGSVGLVTITTVPSQTNQQINSIILKNNSDREFLYFALCGLKEIIKKYGMTGATMSNLSRGKFIDLKLIYPHKKHLENFHEATYPVFEEIKLLQVKNENLRSTRDLLLPRLIAGEVDLEQKGICGVVGIA